MSDNVPVRLHVLIARSGRASRRAAEQLIAQGRVTVNGVTVSEPGTKAMPADDVRVDGKLLRAEETLHYLVLNKPAGYLCSMDDPFGRPLAVSLLKPGIPERVYNVGRLDLESCGLVLFTNDGAFASIAGHPSSGIIKEYEVTTDVMLPPGFAGRFEAGIDDQGETLKAHSIVVTGPKNCTVRLVEGKNREIRRALAVFGIRATILRRIAIGPVRIDGLAEGTWRRLTSMETEIIGQKGVHS